MTCDIVRNNNTGRLRAGSGRYLDGVSGGLVAPGIDMGGGKLMLTGLELRSPHHQLHRRAAAPGELRRGRDAAPPTRTSWPCPTPPSQVGEKNRILRVQGLAQSAPSAPPPSPTSPPSPIPTPPWPGNLQQCAQIIYGDLGVHALGVGAGRLRHPRRAERRRLPRRPAGGGGRRHRRLLRRPQGPRPLETAC